MPSRGRDWADFWDGEGRAAAEAAMAEARVGGTGRFAGFARTAKGTPRWWDVQVTPIPDRDGTPSKLLSISRDITRERERQLAIDEQNAHPQAAGGCGNAAHGRAGSGRCAQGPVRDHRGAPRHLKRCLPYFTAGCGRLAAAARLHRGLRHGGRLGGAGRPG